MRKVFFLCLVGRGFRDLLWVAFRRGGRGMLRSSGGDILVAILEERLEEERSLMAALKEAFPRTGLLKNNQFRLDDII